MLATAERATIVALWLVCCCCHQATARHEHVRTRSGSVREQRTEHLTSGMPAVTAVAAGAADTDGGGSGGGGGGGSSDGYADIDVLADTGKTGANASNANTAGHGKLRDFLFGRPNKIFKSLMRTGVRAVQRGMDVFQGVSNKVYHVARKRIGGSRAGGSSPASGESDGSGSGSAGDRKTVKRQAAAGKKPTGFVRSVAEMLDTGIAGIEQVTDLGLLLGNLGTHKIMATLDGKSGNQEIFNLIIKYVGSKVGKGSKGSAVQFIKDVGTISTFAAKDDDITNAISTVMEKLMSNPKVTKAMVRLGITVLESSPSTSCLLDQLPLSPQDVRMVFDIFVGSNGQMMLKTIAGLVSDLTTGPDTKAFLESALGMMSMFKSDDPDAASNNKDKPAGSIVDTLTNFFTGGDEEEEDDIDNNCNSAPPPVVNNSKKGSHASGTASKPSKKKPKKDDDPWFSNTGSSFGSSAKKSKSSEDPWFSSSGTKSNLSPKKTATPKLDNWFESSGTNSGKSKARGSKNVSDKNNYSHLEVANEKSGSASSSDDNDSGKIAAEPVNEKKKTKTVAKKPVVEEVDDFDSGEYK